MRLFDSKNFYVTFFDFDFGVFPLSFGFFLLNRFCFRFGSLSELLELLEDESLDELEPLSLLLLLPELLLPLLLLLLLLELEETFSFSGRAGV